MIKPRGKKVIVKHEDGRYLIDSINFATTITNHWGSQGLYMDIKLGDVEEKFYMPMMDAIKMKDALNESLKNAYK